MNEFLTNAQAFIIAIIPALTSILSTVAMCSPVLMKFKQLIKAVKADTNIDDLKKLMEEYLHQIDELRKENLELKKKLNEVLTNYDHVYREQIENESNNEKVQDTSNNLPNN